MGLIVPVILCGGSGTRLWPLSRKHRPKPFLPLLGDRTLFQHTLARVADRAIFAAPVIVAGPAHVGQIEAQIAGDAGDAGDTGDAEDTGDAGDTGAVIIVEPLARNTAPAIALAAARLPEGAVMLVCPSDHHVGDTAAFLAAARSAAALARENHLVSFGIAATSPETGYGYIRQGEAIAGGFKIASFVEKPDKARAGQFLAEGNYCWNGGIFAFRAGDFLAELARHRPAMHGAVLRAVEGGSADGMKFHPEAAAFAAIEGESVDYAVMENTGRAAMVPADMAWSDIGNWQALQEAMSGDGAGNIAGPNADLIDCRNVMIRSDGPRVSAIGLEGIVIVVDGDEVLVTTHEGAQLVGKLPGAAEQ